MNHVHPNLMSLLTCNLKNITCNDREGTNNLEFNTYYIMYIIVYMNAYSLYQLSFQAH